MSSERANWVGAPEFYHLNNLCSVLNEAFGYHNYQVGSSLKTRDFRDVDIRCIMDDAEFDAMFGQGKAMQCNAKWSLICASISEWLSNRSGLKVDFQIQRQSDANEKFGLAEHPRNAIGMFVRERCAEGQ